MSIPDHAPCDPAKLLAAWIEWERGQTPPGRVMSNLKTGGLRDVLEYLVATGWVMPRGAEVSSA